MIRAVVDFALNNRFLLILAAVLLLARGAISFHELPVSVEDVAIEGAVLRLRQPPRRRHFTGYRVRFSTAIRNRHRGRPRGGAAAQYLSFTNDLRVDCRRT